MCIRDRFIYRLFRAVLGRKDNSVQPQRFPVFIVFHGDLSFSVREQPCHSSAFAYHSQAVGQPAGQNHRQRQHLWGFAAGIAHHDPLISGSHFQEGISIGSAPAQLQRTIHSCGDVRALFVDKALYSISCRIISHLLKNRTDYGWNMRFIAAGDFSGHNDIPFGGHYLTGHMGKHIVVEAGVQNAVRDDIAQLIRVPFRNRFGGIKLVHFFTSLAGKKA